jgi:hypothetical protein
MRLRACAVAAALAFAACGKYGPPVRASSAPPPKPAPVSAAPATSNTEECQDPNAAAAGAKP